MSRERIVRIEDLPWVESEHGELFASKRRKVSEAAGGRRLGCSMFEVAPGKTAFPFHYHLANEEAMYVLSGEGTLRLGNERMIVRVGDYVAFPCVAEAAHQITNTGSEPLRYLVMSTMIEPDVIVYPDSNKVGVMAGSPPGGDAGARTLTAFFERDRAVGYFHGEPGEPGSSERPQGAAPEQGEASGDLASRIDQTLDAVARKLGIGRAQPAPPSTPGTIEEKLAQLESLLEAERNEQRRSELDAAREAERDRATADEIDAQLAELRKKLRLDDEQ